MLNLFITTHTSTRYSLTAERSVLRICLFREAWWRRIRCGIRK